MVKLYKSPKGKLVVYLPFDVVSQLKLKEDDEVDFFRMNDSSFLMAKKADITGMILGKQQVQPSASQPSGSGLPEEYLTVLKKIDTLRYGNRTPENVSKLLSESEKKVLQRLMAERIVTIFRKDSKELYSISKTVYDNFLMRKKPMQQKPQPQQAAAPQRPVYEVSSTQQPRPQPSLGLDDKDILFLEKNGFLVLQTEAEAARVSILLEPSIRHRQVFGTRAFNKRFYIVRRNYFDANSGRILDKLRDQPRKVTELAEELSLDPEGIKAILYLLSENGDVSEKKRDMFAIA